MDHAIRLVEEKQHSSSKTLSTTNSADRITLSQKETSITEKETMTTTNQILSYMLIYYRYKLRPLFLL